MLCAGLAGNSIRYSLRVTFSPAPGSAFVTACGPFRLRRERRSLQPVGLFRLRRERRSLLPADHFLRLRLVGTALRPMPRHAIRSSTMIRYSVRISFLLLFDQRPLPPPPPRLPPPPPTRPPPERPPPKLREPPKLERPPPELREELPNPPERGLLKLAGRELPGLGPLKPPIGGRGGRGGLGAR